MQIKPIDQYSQYRIQDVIDRLENFRCSIGWGQLNEDLEVAIDCLEYVRDILRDDEEIAWAELQQMLEGSRHDG